MCTSIVWLVQLTNRLNYNEEETEWEKGKLDIIMMCAAIFICLKTNHRLLFDAFWWQQNWNNGNSTSHMTINVPVIDVLYTSCTFMYKGSLLYIWTPDSEIHL